MLLNVKAILVEAVYGAIGFIDIFRCLVRISEVVHSLNVGEKRVTVSFIPRAMIIIYTRAQG